jgi:hypothetical protein
MLYIYCNTDGFDIVKTFLRRKAVSDFGLRGIDGNTVFPVQASFLI